ncbi:general substrate transporter [Aspergillus heterothallicus]
MALLEFVPDRPEYLCRRHCLLCTQSPRWLVSQDRDEEALEALAVVNSQGNKNDSKALALLQQITHSIRRTTTLEGRLLGPLEAWTTCSNRKRLLLVTTFPIIIMLCGDNITTFYFGDMMTQAGIHDSITQLKVNIILSAWVLIIGCVAWWYVDYFSRKFLCAFSLGLFASFLFLLGGLTARFGESDNTSGIVKIA